MYGARVQREMMLERAPLPLQDTTVYAVNEVAWRSLAAKGVGATGQPSLQSTSRPSDGAARTRGSHPAPGFPASRTGSAPVALSGKGACSRRHRRVLRSGLQQSDGKASPANPQPHRSLDKLIDLISLVIRD